MSGALLAAPTVGTNPLGWIAGNPNAQALNGTMLAKGLVSNLGHVTPDLTTEIRIDLDPSQIAADSSFALAFLDPSFSGVASFDVLHVEIDVDGVQYQLFDLGFANALTGLDDLVVPITTGAPSISSITVTYSFDSSFGIGRFASDFALIAVSEPEELFVVALALAALPAVRRRRV